MRFGSRQWGVGLLAATMMTGVMADSASAYLYWNRPDFSGPVVRGDEPGVTLALPGATPAEVQSNLLWTLRAALNVAALQCQFSRPLMTVSNYNTILSQHNRELATAFTTVNGYFKRTQAKTWQRSFDTHTTRLYNGMSTMHAQIGFCETAGKVGRLALAAPRGKLHEVAASYMSEIRNSLIPRREILLTAWPTVTVTAPSYDKSCWSGRGEYKKKCG